HSGLAEVTATLAPALPAGLRDQLSFSLGPGAVSELAAKISGWLPALPAQPQVPAPAQPELAELASTHFGWPEVADGVVAAAQGRLSQLEPADS
ncbi:MAG TPA: hypothetical protein VGJ50_18770, partial [Streptosporangiaceae bacterium]